MTYKIYISAVCIGRLRKVDTSYWNLSILKLIAFMCGSDYGGTLSSAINAKKKKSPKLEDMMKFCPILHGAAMEVRTVQ